MKKIFLSAFVVLSFVFYTIHLRFGDSEESNAVAPNKTPDVSLPDSISQKTHDRINVTPSPQKLLAGSKPSVVPSPTPATVVTQLTGKYKDGDYTGDVADAYYGYVQVKSVIRGGKIVDIVFLDYPQDRKTSIRINTQAMPYLREEAIQAQSADVDIVTGATQTSRAFRESLKSALDKANY